MNNKRILAPIYLTKPGIQILDLGTVKGLFLRSTQPLLTERYTLLGFDVTQKSFLPTASPHTTCAIHDIAEPWPNKLHGTCGLVRQGFTILGGAKKATPCKIIRYPCQQLVKPGGWIQLCEMNVTGTVHGPAMCDA